MRLTNHTKTRRGLKWLCLFAVCCGLSGCVTTQDPPPEKFKTVEGFVGGKRPGADLRP